jgi:hypothetical protein
MQPTARKAGAVRKKASLMPKASQRHWVRERTRKLAVHGCRWVTRLKVEA